MKFYPKTYDKIRAHHKIGVTDLSINKNINSKSLKGAKALKIHGLHNGLISQVVTATRLPKTRPRVIYELICAQNLFHCPFKRTIVYCIHRICATFGKHFIF